MKPILSIITINLNNAEGLQRTMASVFSQVFDSFEYMVIDGGSADRSKELLQQNNEKITYWVSEPDTGVFQAMNKGIRKASGEYLLFLNSGDFLLHDYVLDSVFKNDPYEDILCGTSVISSNGRALYYSDPPDEFSLNFFCSRNIPHQSTFIRKSLFDRYGFYREDFKLKSDYEFWIRTIIFNRCSTRKLNKIITDYNLEGISGDPENTKLANSEIRSALEINVPPSIWIDYKEWFEDPVKMQTLYWAGSRKLSYWFIKLCYRLASIAFSLKSKLKNR